MDVTLKAVMLSWPLDAWTVGLTVVTALIYVRGFLRLRQHRPEQFTPAKLWAFLGGLVVTILALQSPIESLAAFLLVSHMTQHLLLMFAVPPLILLGTPELPMLWGLPRSLRSLIGAILSSQGWRWLRRQA